MNSGYEIRIVRDGHPTVTIDLIELEEERRHNKKILKWLCPLIINMVGFLLGTMIALFLHLNGKL